MNISTEGIYSKNGYERAFQKKGDCRVQLVRETKFMMNDLEYTHIDTHTVIHILVA